MCQVIKVNWDNIFKNWKLGVSNNVSKKASNNYITSAELIKRGEEAAKKLGLPTRLYAPKGSKTVMDIKIHKHRGIRFLTGDSGFSSGSYGHLIQWPNLEQYDWVFDDFGNRRAARKSAEEKINDQIKKGFVKET